MEIHMTTEHLLGFDIRHELEDIRPLDFLHNFDPNITKPRGYSTSAWPSRFRTPISTDYPADPLKTNFREPINTTSDGLFPVYPEYSENFDSIFLWENLGNMLLYYNPNPKQDAIAAFTAFEFDTPEILAYDMNDGCEINIFKSTLWSVYISMTADMVTPNKLYKEQWRFLGYDVSNGETIFEHDADFIKYVGDIAKRNTYGLFEDMNDAIRTCIEYNKYDRNGFPAFIFGIYEAIDINKLSFI